MKTKQVTRYRWLFYKRRTSDDVDAFGESQETISFVTSGFFAYERATKPIEVVDSGATIPETQYALIGRYTRFHHTNIKANYFAWCPTLDKIVEVVGSPVDDSGAQEELIIYVIDNVERDLDTSTLPLG